MQKGEFTQDLKLVVESQFKKDDSQGVMPNLDCHLSAKFLEQMLVKMMKE